MSELITPEEIIARVPEWEGRDVSYQVLVGGLANRSYVATVDGTRYVLKALTQAMGDFNLMIPIEDVCRNTVAAGQSGVGAKVLHCWPEMPAMILEYIDGATLSTPDLSRDEYVPRLGAAVARLHRESAPFHNSISIWKFLDDYLELVDKHSLPTPDGLLGELPRLRTIQTVLTERPLPAVPSHNDLLALNVMDDGEIRLIDYDFSGMNDPLFDLGDVAMEGDMDPDQIARLCESYFGHHDEGLVARARLFGVAAQYTWSLLFVGMHCLLPEAPAEEFDYWAEASSRWDWTSAKLEDGSLDALISRAAEVPVG